MNVARAIGPAFEQIADRYPMRRALAWTGGAWTYAELNARANQLAHFLTGEGIKLETPVGLFAWRGPETLVAMLAILKSGGAYVPLDPAYPPERLLFCLEDAAPALVLCDPAEMDKLPKYSVRIVPLDPGLWAGQPETNPTNDVDRHSLAHVLYTSGSTGTPKGVLIEHGGVLRLTVEMDYAEITPDDVVLQYAPLTFDASTFEIWAAWLTGATLAVPTAGLGSLRDLAAALVSFRVTTAWLTTGLFNILVEQDLESFAGVRQVLTGGDVLSATHAERFLRRFPSAILINGYGPTENTTFSACHRVQLEKPMPARVSIGRPIKGTDVLVVDENLQLLPAGETGELLMTGEGVARGYLNQPELTEKCFVLVRDANGNSVRAYRSGDLGRYRKDGLLDFLGRRDDQVKINGNRIEPGEIRHVLQTHHSVEAAEVIVAESGRLKRLESFSVLRAHAGCSEHELREFLRQKLPANWIPAGVHIVPHLPLGATGKVDRRALLESLDPPRDSPPPARTDEPGDPVERIIWGIWRDLLRANPIPTDVRFSELGGDSLTAMRMLAQVEQVTGRRIALEALLRGGTIRDIAAAARVNGPVPPPPPIICMQTGDPARAPFFFAHGDYLFGGLYCHRVVQHLDTTQPFYALAPPGLFGSERPASLNEIATHYVELIRSVQPHGPYHLGGFCNGAVMAYEAAQQLLRAGDKVASLVMLDPPDFYFFSLRRRIAGLGSTIGLPEDRWRPIYQRCAEGMEVWYNYGAPRLVWEFWKRLAQWIGRSARAVVSPRPAGEINLNFYYYDLMGGYEPKPFPAGHKVLCIQRADDTHRSPAQARFWGPLIPGVRFRMVPGSHMELKDCIGEIASVIETGVAS
jgi:amino acid adenylation domain-containing protein